MNLPLDQVIRRVVQDPGFRSAAEHAGQRAADLAGVPLTDLTAVLEGDLVTLHHRGAHPLLVMQLAGALGIDPMQRFGADHPAHDLTERETMKITVDLERCEGFASCVVSAPELFDLDDERNVAVVLEPVAGDARALALEAAASCPVRAITVIDPPVDEPQPPAARPVTDGVSLDAVATAVERLHQAAVTGTPCAPVRDVLPPTLAAGYAVQQVLSARAVAVGRRAVGRKVGLTNPVVQRQLGVDQPDLGVLFEDMAVADGGTVDAGRLIQPRIEAEVALILGADLAGPDLTTEHVRAAVAEVAAALEIVDSRIAGWDISLVDTVADNASSGLFVLGSQRRPLDDLDLRAVRMTLCDDDGEVSTGTGADCLGDPLAALAWLAAAARDLGQPLRAGDVVLSGALGPMVPVRAGATYTAEVSGLGPVAVTFGAGEPA